MRRLRQLAALLGLLLLMSVTATAEPAAKALWTLMVYLDADNDLERPMMQNLADMARVGSSATVNLIVLAARNAQGDGLYTNAPVLNIPNWTNAKLLQVQQGKLIELDDWGALDMGDPSTLGRFLTRVTSDFPAERYGVIFGDHGMAWAGLAVAESNDSDSLGIGEVGSMLKGVTKTAGRFELIGFDACVMANLEVARTLAPFARYMVASEEIEPSAGWDYAAVLSAVERSPQMDGAALGRVIVDTYRDSFAKSAHHERQQKAKALTLSVIDLDKVASIDKATAALGSGAHALLTRGGHDAWIHLAHARNDAEEYGRTAAPGSEPRLGSEVYDLVHVAENLKQRAQDKAATAAADSVIAAVRQAIVYSIHGEARPHANGMSIFFPPDQATLAVRGKTSYNETDFAQINAWYPFLLDYTALPASDAERNRPKPAIDPLQASGRMVSHGSEIKITSQAHGDDIEDASFVLSMVDNGSRVVIGSIPVDLDSKGDLKEDWDGEWFTISDGNEEFIAPITSFEELSDGDEEDVYWAEVPAQLRVSGTTQWLDVTLGFVLDFKEEEVTGDFIYAVEYTRHGPREIDVDVGDDLRPMYEVIDAAGKAALAAADGHVMHIDDLDDLKVKRDPVPSGRYQVGFLVRSLGGRHSESFVDVDVE